MRARVVAALERYRPIAVVIAAIWIAHLVNVAVGGALTPLLGLTPRRIEGLDGVVFMPFIHGGFDHLIANTAPLLALGATILTIARDGFWRSTAIVVLLGGLLLWFLGRTSIHIGASGLVFGWFGFLVALGAFHRSAGTIVGAVLAAALYGAPALLGLAPGDEGVSWDAHLAGLIAGVAAAWTTPKTRGAPRWPARPAPRLRLR